MVVTVFVVVTVTVEVSGFDRSGFENYFDVRISGSVWVLRGSHGLGFHCTVPAFAGLGSYHGFTFLNTGHKEALTAGVPVAVAVVMVAVIDVVSV